MRGADRARSVAYDRWQLTDELCIGENGGQWTAFTHQSVIKTTFLLYFMLLGGMMATCDEMGAVLIIGHWRPFG